jgi:hypothetical protein
VRELITPGGARFLLCRLSRTDPAYLKYPPQPVVRCDGYRAGGNDERVEALTEAASKAGQGLGHPGYFFASISRTDRFSRPATGWPTVTTSEPSFAAASA